MLNLSQLHQDIQLQLRELVKTHTPKQSFSKIYEYTLFPPGKLFRPLLARTVSLDNQQRIGNNNYLFESSLEIHHVYTLIHDDLPCMDDDDIRRGKSSAHKQFNEWQALLAGDGLQALSYRLISLIKSANQQEILKYYSWALGTKGLIMGQALDLENSAQDGLEYILEIHKLKTSRLIQASLVGAYLLSETTNLKMAKLYHRLGHGLGISFQLLDDLNELGEKKLNYKESAKNPFILYKTKLTDIFCEELEKINSSLSSVPGNNLEIFIKDYLKNQLQSITSNKDHIRRFVLEEDLDRIETLLNQAKL